MHQSQEIRQLLTIRGMFFLCKARLRWDNCVLFYEFYRLIDAPSLILETKHPLFCE